MSVKSLTCSCVVKGFAKPEKIITTNGWSKSRKLYEFMFGIIFLEASALVTTMNMRPD